MLLSDQLREAIRKAGESRYRISQATGIAESVLSRFVNGKGSVDMATADKLGAYLGLALTRTQTTRKAR